MSKLGATPSREAILAAPGELLGAPGEAISQIPRDTPAILLVEDDLAYGALVRQLLQHVGMAVYDFLQVTRLDHALDYLAESRVRCVLLDLSLPDAEGMEAVERLRANAPDMPLIVLTGRDDEEVGLAAVQAGAQDYLTKSSADGSLLARAIRYALERKRAEAALSHQAMHDALTGLPNRTLFLDRLEVALARALRRPTSVGLLFIDLDRFKVVNDSLGHEAGDALLVAAAKRLARVLRPGDTLARIGGDEFTVLCEELRQADSLAIARRLQEVLSTPFNLPQGDVTVTASIGIALARPDDTASVLLRAADTAMYRAKELGRARFEFFDHAARQRATARFRTELELRVALERGELAMHYQPIVSLKTGIIAGLEALIRWRHPTRGLVAAGEFVPIAEETGLIVPLGGWALRQACAEVQLWRRRHWDRPLWLAVNIAARQLDDQRLPGMVEEALEEAGMLARDLCLEITESAVMTDVESSAETLQALDALGLRLAIDDFGTGYSSLVYLKRFPVRLLKVDGSFVDGLGSEPEDSAIVESVVGLAHTLGHKVVAEGVEHPRQLDELRALGCDFAQGYLLGRPGPLQALSPAPS